MIRETAPSLRARLSALRPWLALGTALALSACDDAEVDPRDGLATGRGSDGYEVSGYVSENRNGPLIRGARVCIASEPQIPCALSDAAGHYAMRLPVWDDPRELAVHVTAPGYLGYVGMVRASPSYDRRRGEIYGWWRHSIDLQGEATLDELTRAWQVDQPSTERGHVLVDVWYRFSGTPVGAQVALSREREPQPRFLEVPSTGQVFFTEVPPGRFEVAIEGCTPRADDPSLWRGRTRGAVAGLAVAGAITKVTVSCQEEGPAEPRRTR